MPVSKIHLWVAVSCIIGFVINFLAFTPGFMSPDSFDQYAQSISHHYNDWHPPAMAFVWSLLNRIYQGPQVMLALQLSFLWLACYYIVTLFSNRVWAICILLFFLLSPIIQNFSGYIIKDTQMAFSWLLASAIMLRAADHDRKMSVAEVTGSLALLIYGTWVRPNALPGLLPLIAWWISMVYDGPAIKKIALTCGMVLLIVAGQMFIPRALDTHKLYAENKLYLHDLTAIYAKTGENVYPSILYTNPNFDTAYLRSKYHPATFDDIWWNSDGKTFLPDTSKIVTEAITSAWKKGIASHPSVYLHHRWQGFLYYLRIKQRTDFYCTYYMAMYPDPKSFGYTFAPNYNGILYKFYDRTLKAQERMFYMQGWFWYLVNFLLLLFIPLLKDKNIKRAYLALVCSGILYKLPDLFVYQCDTDYRYFYWNCIACTIAIILLIASRVFDIQQIKKGSN